MTRQTLRAYRDIAASLPKATNKFVADYSAVKEDINKNEKNVVIIFDTIKDLVPLFGVGSPEGVTAANLSQIYFDTTNTPTTVTMYTNENVGSNTGWVVVA